MSLDVQLEMGITRREFSRTLPNAILPFVFTEDTHSFRLSDTQGREVFIKVLEQPPRVIAGLSIPVALVHLYSTDLNAVEAEDFMARFHRYFHRGGG